MWYLKGWRSANSSKGRTGNIYKGNARFERCKLGNTIDRTRNP